MRMLYSLPTGTITYSLVPASRERRQGSAREGDDSRNEAVLAVVAMPEVRAGRRTAGPGSRLKRILGPLSAAHQRYAYVRWAAASVTVATLIRHFSAGPTGIRFVYLPYMLAVFVSSYFGGVRSGILALLLSSVIIVYMDNREGGYGGDLYAFSIFSMAAVAIIYLMWLVEQRERTVRLARQRADNLQAKALATARELDLLIDSAIHYAIYMLDPQGRVVIWNMGAERLFGWTEREIIGQAHDVLFMDDDRQADMPSEMLRMAARTGRAEGPATRLRRDGTVFDAHVVLSRIESGAGALIGFGTVVRDITQERANAAAIESRSMLLRSILDTVPDAMVVTDDQGLIVSFSAAAQAMFGYSEGEALGRSASMLMAPEGQTRFAETMKLLRETGVMRVVGQVRRDTGIRKDSSTFPYEIFVGEAIGGGRRMFTAFIKDLSAQEAADARLQELQTELLHVSRVSAVGTMASTLAHELNQPLTAVTNYVQTSATLLESETSGTSAIVREALVEAGREALRAGEIVRHLREFVARGELDRTIEPVAALVDNASALGMIGARGKGVRLKTRIAPEVGWVLVDRVQIQQVLVNLMRNAVEAAPPTDGLVGLTVEPEGNMLCFTVTDNGPGVSPELAESLFSAFVSTKARGMGLGLSICRTIIEAHGGRIWCDGAPGGGAAFHFTVPAVGQDADDE